MICSIFGRDPATRHLTNELADALAEAGATVRVAVIEWNAPAGRESEHRVLENGVEALFIPPRWIDGAGRIAANASKWLFASWFMVRPMRQRFGDGDFDLVIGFSPLVVTGYALRWAIRRFRCRAFAYITDFFPFHHRAAGLIPAGPFFGVGRAFESQLMRLFDIIGVMSPAGADYLREHYRLRPNQGVEVLRLWSDLGNDLVPSPTRPRAEVRRAFGLPVERPIILFGGQITEGRGIEDLLAAARLAAAAAPDLLFLFVGRGRLEPLVEAAAASGPGNVLLRGAIPRDDYLSLVAACDIGIVATIAGSGVPTFPSKTLDYLRAGIPILASVEASTDYRDFVRENDFGVVVDAGAPEQIVEAAQTLMADPGRRERMIENGRRTLRSHFDVRRTAERVLGWRAAKGAP